MRRNCETEKSSKTSSTSSTDTDSSSVNSNKKRKRTTKFTNSNSENDRRGRAKSRDSGRRHEESSRKSSNSSTSTERGSQKRVKKSRKVSKNRKKTILTIWEKRMIAELARNKKKNDVEFHRLQKTRRLLEEEKVTFEQDRIKMEHEVEEKLEKVTKEMKKYKKLLTQRKKKATKLKQRNAILDQDSAQYEHDLLIAQTKSKINCQEDERLEEKHSIFIQEDLRFQNEKKILLQFLAKCTAICQVNRGQNVVNNVGNICESFVAENLNSQENLIDKSESVTLPAETLEVSTISEINLVEMSPVNIENGQVCERNENSIPVEMSPLVCFSGDSSEIIEPEINLVLTQECDGVNEILSLVVVSQKDENQVPICTTPSPSFCEPNESPMEEITDKDNNQTLGSQSRSSTIGFDNSIENLTSINLESKMSSDSIENQNIETCETIEITSQSPFHSEDIVENISIQLSQHCDDVIVNLPVTTLLSAPPGGEERCRCVGTQMSPLRDEINELQLSVSSDSSPSIQISPPPTPPTPLQDELYDPPEPSVENSQLEMKQNERMDPTSPREEKETKVFEKKLFLGSPPAEDSTEIQDNHQNAKNITKKLNKKSCKQLKSTKKVLGEKTIKREKIKSVRGQKKVRTNRKKLRERSHRQKVKETKRTKRISHRKRKPMKKACRLRKHVKGQRYKIPVLTTRLKLLQEKGWGYDHGHGDYSDRQSYLEMVASIKKRRIITWPLHTQN